MKCKICGKEVGKGFWLHVHRVHGLKKAEYEKLDVEQSPQEVDTAEEIVNPEDTEEVSVSMIEKVLEKHGISLDKLVKLLDDRLGHSEQEDAETQAQSILNNLYGKVRSGEMQANKLAGPEKLTVKNLFVAEALIKNHGYAVVDVTSNPKEWHLKKK